MNQKVSLLFRLAFAAIVLLSSLSISVPAHAVDNGLARTPPMGWNSWNHFHCDDLNEKLVRQTADAIATNGMKDAGYQYVVLDDCWQSSRDAEGNIVADPAKFPSGIKALADYVHDRGLRFGLYTDAGMKTCAGRPGSLGHEYQDAKRYAAWGVDYLKEDWCSTLPAQNTESSYTVMRDALAASGRPIVFSICEWGSTKPWLWAGAVGNMWRSTGDILDCWQCKMSWGGNSLSEILDLMSGFGSYSGPGHWNDLDMLQVGNGGMTEDEYRTNFGMWAIFAAPLIAGNDVVHMSTATREILTNKEVIAIDQDPLGQAGSRVMKTGDLEVWSKQLADGSRAVAMLNKGGTPAKIAVNWNDIGYPTDLTASVRDLWSHKDIGRLKGSYSAEVPVHGIVMVKVKP
jgi:alpha-galactosidase